MPLIRNTDDLRFIKQLDVLNQRRQFVYELASAVLPVHDGFQTACKLANRVYDLYCSPRAGGPDSGSLAQSGMTALSA
jgi:hypothetical protein